MNKAFNYCRKIKSKAKQSYAFKYHRYLLGMSEKPERPDNLSYMAAHAVEINLSEFLA